MKVSTRHYTQCLFIDVFYSWCGVCLILVVWIHVDLLVLIQRCFFYSRCDVCLILVVWIHVDLLVDIVWGLVTGIQVWWSKAAICQPAVTLVGDGTVMKIFAEELHWPCVFVLGKIVVSAVSKQLSLQLIIHEVFTDTDTVVQCFFFYSVEL
jgi:hypothetical protein